jgi:FixJ family two-component response regulator
VVDDEKAVRTALQHVFQSAEIDVTTFGSGDEFLNSIETHRPDCIVLDLHMPGLTGLDVQRRLRGIRPLVPVVVITGKDEPGVQESVFAAGAAAYLVKPLDDQALLEAIEAAVNSTHVNRGAQ